MVVGQAERSLHLASPRDYEHRFTRLNDRFALINHGFDFVELDLSEPIPAAVDIVMIADPRANYSEDMRSNLRSYIAGGGDMALLMEPDSPTALDAVLTELGLTRGRPVTQDSDPRFPPAFVLAQARSGVIDAYWGEETLDLPVALDTAVSLQTLEDDRGFTRAPVLIFDDQAMGYSLERLVGNERQRIVVYGDADVFSNANAGRSQPSTNIATAFSTFHWLTDAAYPVQRTRREPVDNDVRIGLGTLTALKWILIGAIPLAILIAGGSLLLVRRRR